MCLTFSLGHGICHAKPEKWHFRSGREEGPHLGMELERVLVLKAADRDGKRFAKQSKWRLWPREGKRKAEFIVIAPLVRTLCRIADPAFAPECMSPNANRAKGRKEARGLGWKEPRNVLGLLYTPQGHHNTVRPACKAHECEAISYIQHWWN